MNINLFVRLSAFMLLIYSQQALTEERMKKLKVAYVEFPPIEYKDNTNQPAGSFITITEAVLRNANIDYEFVFLPISRTYLYLKEGKVDMWPGLSAIPSLQGYVLESKSVPTSITLSAWYLKGTKPITSIRALAGSNTILINGYTYGGLLYKITAKQFGMTPLYTTSHLSGLQMLERRRGDYLLDYNEPISSQLKDYPVEDLTFSVLNKRNAAFLVSKKYPNAKQLIQTLDLSYDQLIFDGKIKPRINN